MSWAKRFQTLFPQPVQEADGRPAITFEEIGVVRFPETTDTFLLTAEADEQISVVLESFRNTHANKPYSSIQTIKDRLIGTQKKHESYRRTPEDFRENLKRHEILEQAEKNFAAAIMLANQKEPGGINVLAQDKLPLLQKQLARIYADNEAYLRHDMLYDTSSTALAERARTFERMIAGTFTTFITNEMKRKGVITEPAASASRGY